MDYIDCVQLFSNRYEPVALWENKCLLLYKAAHVFCHIDLGVCDIWIFFCEASNLIWADWILQDVVKVDVELCDLLL